MTGIDCNLPHSCFLYSLFSLSSTKTLMMLVDSLTYTSRVALGASSVANQPSTIVSNQTTECCTGSQPSSLALTQ